MSRGKKIGKSILGQKGRGLKLRPPTPEEIEELKRESAEEKRAEEKDKELEKSGETKLPRLPMPSDVIEPEHKQKLPISLADIEKTMEKEGIEIAEREAPDRRLKEKKKVRFGIKELTE